VSEVREVSEDGNSIITTIAGPQTLDDSNSSPAVHFRTRMSYLGTDCSTNYAPPKEDTRLFRYEATFIADGKRYQLHTDYQ
jgi:hypothetical protein